MYCKRFYTKADQDLYTEDSLLTVTRENHATYIVPHHWDQAAVDILQEKVFYPEVLPATLRRIKETDVPAWLWRTETNHNVQGTTTEKDIRAVLHRIAGAVTYAAWKNKVFAAEEDAKTFYDELRYILLHRIAAPELKQWQLLGLDWAYGITDAPSYTLPIRTVTFKADTPQALRQIKILGETLALEKEETKTTVILPVENSASLAFINWKRNSDTRQVAEALGRRVMETAAHQVMDACDCEDTSGFDPAKNVQLHQAMNNARRAGLPESAIQMALRYAEQGYEEISFAASEEEKAEDHIKTILSIPDDFIESALTDHSYKHRPAQKLWQALTEAIWSSGEPGISFRNSVEADDPVAKIMTDKAAPSATINLLACAGDKEIVNTAALQHVTQVMLTTLEALPASLPEYRPVQLGMTNMAALLMSKGLAYDSEAGRATAALVTGLVSGAAYQTSAEMAAAQGAFPAYNSIARKYLQNIKNKMAALSGAAFLQKGMMRRPVQLHTGLCPDVFLVDAVKKAWDSAYHLGKETGFRHAQLTGINTDETLQAFIGAQTWDIMPVTTLLHGISLNPLVPAALKSLGYSTAECNDIYVHVTGHKTLENAPQINHKRLREKGFTQASLDATEAALKMALHIRYVFNKWTLGEEFCSRILGFSAEELNNGMFDMLHALGFTEEQITAANTYCCGTMTIEGAPHLKSSHFEVFDCHVSPASPIKMQAALEPFLSREVAQTVTMDYTATIEDVQKLILSAWEMGIKNLRLYRENGTLLHAIAMPLEKNTNKNSEENQIVIRKNRKISA